MDTEKNIQRVIMMLKDICGCTREESMEILKLCYSELTNPPNLNSPKYWDGRYKEELEKNLDYRSDEKRWNLMLDDITDGVKVLDFGCGWGAFLGYLSSKRPLCKLHGVDFSPYALEKGRQLNPAAVYSETIPQNETYDVISIQHVLEHMDTNKQIPFLKDIKLHLNKGGLMILAMPINDDPWIEHQCIYQLEDAMTIISQLDYAGAKMIHRKYTKFQKKDGTRVQELLIFMVFP